MRRLVLYISGLGLSARAAATSVHRDRLVELRRTDYMYRSVAFSIQRGKFSLQNVQLPMCAYSICASEATV